MASLPLAQAVRAAAVFASGAANANIEDIFFFLFFFDGTAAVAHPSTDPLAVALGPGRLLGAVDLRGALAAGGRRRPRVG